MNIITTNNIIIGAVLSKQNISKLNLQIKFKMLLIK